MQPGLHAPGGASARLLPTLHEFLDRCERLAVDPGPLPYASRTAAKVGSSALQDGYQLYTHACHLFPRLDVLDGHRHARLRVRHAFQAREIDQHASREDAVLEGVD
ncbi:MAG: DUF763 domain-containing protein [Acidimicrobiia bacterium]|nr:DUF763 domain-containing protein [Acidimicrobiia bacterium]